MRKAFLAAVLFFGAATLFGTCFTLSNITGSQQAPCMGGIEYSRVDVTPHEITVTKTLDKASLQLFHACATGQHLQQGSLKPSGTEDIELKDVTVSSWSQSGDGNGNVVESVTLNFTKIEYKYGNQTVQSFTGGVRSGMTSVKLSSADGSDGGKIQRFTISVRPGGAAVTSVQLVPAVTPAPLKAGVMKVGTPVSAAPQPHFSSGFLQVGSMRFQLNGGTLLNGNLRANASISPR
ncbi:MAG TPA: type VI secretion system tube protein Hcp [Thermoanaerobaculia bacterium]|nr:type VI secretion system tube protein Hcp [Thermoanaerobaculia bacterium]